MRYALRLIAAAAPLVTELHLVASDAALRVLAEEEDIKVSGSRLSAETLLGHPIPNLVFHNVRDIGAAIASGTFLCRGMVIVPCSMNTMGAIAAGVANNLVQRAAEVTLKEGRRLIVVPRETPLSMIHLENMLKVGRSGAVVLPAMPGFYHKPSDLNELIDMLVMKIMDQMGLPQNTVQRWGENEIRKVD